MSRALPLVVNPVLVTAMAHPTRVHALTWLIENPTTPADIAKRLGLPINNVMHHIRVLEKLGCVELVSVEQAQGGRVAQQLYRATVRPSLDADAWEQLGDTEKMHFYSTLLRLVSGDISEAMLYGTMYDPDDNHLTRSPLNLDMEGWDEVIELLDATVDGLSEIQANVTQRCGSKETFPVKVEILHFRSPHRKVREEG